ncbi:MAG TPA: VanZ family protein [Edaphocola sp.]|nr:VanZ family protein [Edaphocola sp.]
MLSIFQWFKNHKKIAALCASFWAAIIFAACLIPGRDVPSLSIFQYDKLVHFGIFGILAFQILYLFKNPRPFPHGISIWILVTIYGYLIEFLQGSGLTQGRSYDGLDALADSIGAGIGIGCFLIMEYFSSRRKQQTRKNF